MTTLTIDPADVLSDAAATVVGSLTPAVEWTLAAIDQPGQVAPWPDARAVVLSTNGLQIAVLLNGAAAQRLAGELPAALATAAATIAPGVPTAGAGDVDPANLLAAINEHQCAAAQLVDGGEHVATLLLIATTTPEAAADASAPAGPAPHEFAALEAGMAKGGNGALDVLFDVEMGVTAELGRTRMLVRDVLELCPGSVIELDRAAGAPVDVLVNGMLIARGEVVVIDEEFGVRITEVIGYQAAPRGGVS